MDSLTESVRSTTVENEDHEELSRQEFLAPAQQIICVSNRIALQGDSYSLIRRGSIERIDEDCAEISEWPALNALGKTRQTGHTNAQRHTNI